MVQVSPNKDWQQCSQLLVFQFVKTMPRITTFLNWHLSYVKTMSPLCNYFSSIAVNHMGLRHIWTSHLIRVIFKPVDQSVILKQFVLLLFIWILPKLKNILFHTLSPKVLTDTSERKLVVYSCNKLKSN